jgi:acetyl-CoA carboxylase biotin carboxylase subunit
MRRVDSEDTLLSSLSASRSEAQNAFGSSEVYVEKLVIEPRHIEIQVLADEHGNCVYLGERECSIQRRNQKVIEEAPSAVVGPDLRRRMGEAAVKLVLAAGYTNAGTVEFLLDDQEKFYFLEVNTRLQVEHPVTELVTGLDLVHLQLHIAQGLPLPFSQEDVKIRGHAMECRIYAEDPANNFFPSPGKITRLSEASGPGIRVDSGVYEGWTVPLDYDPMLAKLIAFAPTRETAIARLLRALDETFVGGIATNVGLFRQLLNDPEFRAARIHTGYLDKLLQAGATDPIAEEPASDTLEDPMLPYAALAALLLADSQIPGEPVDLATESTSVWKQSARAEGLRR